MVEISWSGPVHDALAAVCLHGAVLAALGTASKDLTAAGSSANLTKHAAESRGQSGGGPLCCRGYTASRILKLEEGGYPKVQVLQLE